MQGSSQNAETFVTRMFSRGAEGVQVMPRSLPDSIFALREKIEGGELAVSEALSAQHRAIARADQYNCVTYLFPQAQNKVPSAQLPLAGVGLAHKDIFCMGNRVPDRGMGLLQSDPLTCAQNAVVVQRLQNKGATLLAALTMAEHACGATGENPNLPLPRNPIDFAAAVGGSSSGSAVAVAAGLCYGSLGTDTAGSVRIPAATCGVVGFKPSREYLPRTGMSPLALSLDAVGIVARTAQDVEILFQNALSEKHRALLMAGICGRTTDVYHNRESVAVCLDHFNPYADPTEEIKLSITRFASCAFGAQWVTRTLPDFPDTSRLTDILLNVEVSRAHLNNLRDGIIPLGRLTRTIVLAGAAIPAGWYAEALDRRVEVTRLFLETAFKDVDFLITPVLPQGVPDWDEVRTMSPTFNSRAWLNLFAWTSIFNYLDLPVIVFPIGTDQRNRPISIQLIGRKSSELRLLRFASYLQKAAA